MQAPLRDTRTPVGISLEETDLLMAATGVSH